MAKSDKKEIGKGIRALLANIEKEETKTIESHTLSPGQQDSSLIGIARIETNPFQPRTEFDREALEELAASIKTFGIIQPITVRRLNSKQFQIISGERRWRAAKIAGLEKIPAYVREADDQGMLEMALLENIQRTDLNPLEIALSYQRLIDECRLTHDALSERLGKKRSTVSNYLRILKLPPSVQKALQRELISMGHAKVIAGLPEVENQVALLEAVLTKGLSVRGAEHWKDKLSIRTDPKSAEKIIHPEIVKMQDRLSDLFGKKVAIKRSIQGKGVLSIPFDTDDELNHIIESILE